MLDSSLVGSPLPLDALIILSHVNWLPVQKYTYVSTGCLRSVFFFSPAMSMRMTALQPTALFWASKLLPSFFQRNLDAPKVAIYCRTRLEDSESSIGQAWILRHPARFFHQGAYLRCLKTAYWDNICLLKSLICCLGLSGLIHRLGNAICRKRQFHAVFVCLSVSREYTVFSIF